MVAVSVVDDNGRALPLSGCGFFFFFFAAIWVDLMVVVGCGLWAVGGDNGNGGGLWG